MLILKMKVTSEEQDLQHFIGNVRIHISDFFPPEF